ncbi:MAG: ATP-binding protein [Pseudomonadota bacterium]
MHADSLIDALLFEAEGAEIDFKRAQYIFEGADDRTKSELLKDILAFANAWRRTDAYILIGIQEVPEGESAVVGITEHIDDAKLQQFVNAKTNRPVEFSYSPMPFRSKQIGVIHIPVQERPIYLIKDYGILRRNTVYLRRGSSTDEARPDEIARMGQAVSEASTLRPLLVPRLAIGSDWSELVETATFETICLKCPEIQSLPDYDRPQQSDRFGMPTILYHGHANSGFYRDRAEYWRFEEKLRPICMAIRNDGTALASGVKFTIQVIDPMHLIELALDSERPKAPKREWSPIHDIHSISMNKTSPDIEFTKTNAGWTISAYFGKVQAKDTAVTSAQLFVGISTSGLVELPVSVFADELSTPVIATLSVEYKVTEQEVPVEQLTR